MSQFIFKNIAVACAITCGISLSGCSSDTPPAEFATGPVELPALSSDANCLFVSHSTPYQGMNVNTFSLEYDKAKKHARWVAFKFYNTTGETNVDRSPDDSFAPDPAINIKDQRTRNDFGRKGYDRGHLCASADRVYDSEANKQTFYYSNMSPQKNSFNAGIWRELEAMVQRWGRNNSLRDTLYVVKGAALNKPEYIEKYIGGDKSKPVPKYYFMALLNKKGDGFKAIAFWLDQTRSYPRNEKLAQYAITIDELEERTDIDFFHYLNDPLENAVESSIQTSAWSGL